LKTAKPGIHIINSHYVDEGTVDIEKSQHVYEGYIRYLLSFSKIIDLSEASRRIVENQIPQKEVLLALTYDDGFEECYTVIAPILEKYGLKGAFFINANYIDSDDAYEEQFNIRTNNKGKKPMTWEQVIELNKRGHIIGSHGLDHFNFENLNTDEITQQVEVNKKILEEKLNYTCDHFAWTYGQLMHFSEGALTITSNFHPFIYSGTNYKSYFSYNGRVINRRHHEPFWKKSHIKYFFGVQKNYNK
jgi:peptidoglycan/xylan/chitin deacetylase (PgdA/CDA1 family)